MLKPPCHVLVAIAFLLQTVLSQTCSDSSRMVAVVSVADLVQRWAHELDSITLVGDVLDLACGKGQNGYATCRVATYISTSYRFDRDAKHQL